MQTTGGLSVDAASPRATALRRTGACNTGAAASRVYIDRRATLNQGFECRAHAIDRGLIHIEAAWQIHCEWRDAIRNFVSLLCDLGRGQPTIRRQRAQWREDRATINPLVAQ